MWLAFCHLLDRCKDPASPSATPGHWRSPHTASIRRHQVQTPEEKASAFSSHYARPNLTGMAHWQGTLWGTAPFQKPQLLSTGP